MKKLFVSLHFSLPLAHCPSTPVPQIVQNLVIIAFVQASFVRRFKILCVKKNPEEKICVSFFKSVRLRRTFVRKGTLWREYIH